jgi:hypothetical protein
MRLNRFGRDYGVPIDGGEAFMQGWDVKACPFIDAPDKRRWIAEWEAASAKAWEECVITRG